MPIRALITRPIEDAAAVAAALRARDVEVTVEPLLVVQTRQDAEIPLDGVQAILFTSANGVRAFATLSQRRDLPALCVGDATAAAAQAAGFTAVRSAGGDVRDLAVLARDTLSPENGALLHAAGTAVAGDLAQLLGADGFEVRRVELYSATPVDALTPATLRAIAAAEFDMVLLFSPRTAATFVKLLQDAPDEPGEDGVSRTNLVVGCARMVALCLSPAVAQAASGMTWAAVRVAARPDLPSMLALVDGAVGEIKGDVGRYATTTQPTEAERAINRAGATLPEEVAAPRPRQAEPQSDVAAPPFVAAEAGARRRGSGSGAAVAAALVAIVVSLVLLLTQGWWLPALGLAPWADRGEGAEVLLTERIALAEERLDEAIGTVSALDEQVAAFRQQLAALNDLVGSGQRELAALQQSGGAAAGDGALPAAIAALPDEVSALSRRLDELARTPAGAATDSAAVQAALEAARAESKAETAAVRDLLLKEIADLRTAMASGEMQARSDSDAQADLAARVAALDSRLAELDRIVGGRATEVAGAAVVLAIGQLRAVLDSARPFAGELTALEQVAAEAPDLAASIAPLVAPLRDLAGDGVPTLMQLRETFPETARAVLEAANRETVTDAVGAPSEGWMRDVVESISGLVTVRPVGDAEGDSPGARVARAELRLAEGSLAEAVSELAELQGAPGEAAAPWLEKARARLVAQSALDELNRTALEQLAGMAAERRAAPAAEEPPAPSESAPGQTPEDQTGAPEDSGSAPETVSPATATDG